MTWDEAWSEIRRELVNRYGDPDYHETPRTILARVMVAAGFTSRQLAASLGFQPARIGAIFCGRLTRVTLAGLERKTGIPKAWWTALSSETGAGGPTPTLHTDPNLATVESFPLFAPAPGFLKG